MSIQPPFSDLFICMRKWEKAYLGIYVYLKPIHTSFLCNICFGWGDCIVPLLVDPCDYFIDPTESGMQLSKNTDAPPNNFQ